MEEEEERKKEKLQKGCRYGVIFVFMRNEAKA
jgi:hypothetical protein